MRPATKKRLLRAFFVFLCIDSDGYFPHSLSVIIDSAAHFYVLIRIKLEPPQLIVSNTAVTTSFPFTSTHRLYTWDSSENDLGSSRLDQPDSAICYQYSVAPSPLTRSSVVPIHLFTSGYLYAVLV